MTVADVKRDRAAEPFRVAVAFGESTTAGGSATARERSWVGRLEALINESQATRVRMINTGLGANVISPRSPTYARSGRPSAFERHRRQVIDHRPDLVLVSFGLNDARGGTPLAQFLEDLGAVIGAVAAETGAVMVLLSTYHMTGFDRYPTFDQADIDDLRRFNAGLQRLAEERGILYADVFAAQAESSWMVDADGVHANDLGHLIIANGVFEVLAQNCSCLSETAVIRSRDARPWRDESVLRAES